MAMFKKLLPLVNRFVYLRQGYFNRYYEGKLIEVLPETLTIQSYDEQGKPDAEWVIALSTVTEFMVGDRDLDELNMRVCLAKTLQQEELDAADRFETQVSLHPEMYSLSNKRKPFMGELP
jgi:hypothetical protein